MPTYSSAEQARQRAAISPADQWRREAEVWFDGSVESVECRLAACDRLLATSREAIAHDGIGSHTRKHFATISDLEQQRGALAGLRRDLLTAAADREAYFDHDPAALEDGERAHDRFQTGEEFGHHMEAPSEQFVREPGFREAYFDGDPADVGDGEHAYERWQTGEEFGHHQGPPSEQLIREPGFHEGGLSAADRRYVELEAAKFFRANSDCPVDELAIRARHHAELQTSTFTQSRSRAITAAFVRKSTQLRRAAPRPRVAMAPPRPLDCPDELMFM